MARNQRVRRSVSDETPQIEDYYRGFRAGLRRVDESWLFWSPEAGTWVIECLLKVPDTGQRIGRRLSLPRTAINAFAGSAWQIGYDQGKRVRSEMLSPDVWENLPGGDQYIQQPSSSANRAKSTIIPTTSSGWIPGSSFLRPPPSVI